MSASSSPSESGAPAAGAASSKRKRAAPGSGSNPENRTCGVCERVFSKRCHLLRHYRTHAGAVPLGEDAADTPHAPPLPPDPRTACPLCPKVFSRTDALKRHLRLKHGHANVAASGNTGVNALLPEETDNQDEVTEILQSLSAASNSHQSAGQAGQSQPDLDAPADSGSAIAATTCAAELPGPSSLTNGPAIAVQPHATIQNLATTEDHATIQAPAMMMTTANVSNDVASWQRDIQHNDFLVPGPTVPLASEPSPFSGFQAYFNDLLDFPSEQAGPSTTTSHDAFRLSDNQIASAWDSLTLWQIPGLSSEGSSAHVPHHDPAREAHSSLAALGESWENQIQALNGLFNVVSRPSSPLRPALPLAEPTAHVQNKPDAFYEASQDSGSAGYGAAYRNDMYNSASFLPAPVDLPRRASHTVHTQPSPPRLNADTWQADIREDDTNDAALEASQVITSPEDVVRELRFATAQIEGSSLIPSLSFLDSCIYLYFKFFHAQFPILHQPTFDRDKAPKFLLLSICSIGCMFMGTPEARTRGLQIYEQLHHVIISTRDSKMAVERTRVAVVLAALLGQSYSFLSGQAKHLYTGEGFHGWLCTCARRAGILGLVDMPSSTFNEVRSLSGHRLEQAWRQWAYLQTLKRACHGLVIHACETTAYSAVPRLLPARIEGEEGNQDLLFEAESSQEWYNLLQLQAANKVNKIIKAPMFHFALACQHLVDVHSFRELQKSRTAFYTKTFTTQQYYLNLRALAERLAISPSETSYERVSSKQRVLHVLWNYSCIAWLSRINIINEAAGRVGAPRAQAVHQIKEWVVTAAARLAVLHSAHVLLAAVELRDQAFVVPRAIFHAALVISCYLTYAPRSTSRERVNCADVDDWYNLADACDFSRPHHQFSSSTGGANSIHSATAVPPPSSTSASRKFVLEGGSSSLIIPGFIDGHSSQVSVDNVGFRCEAALLLRRCTPWGIGESLAEILAGSTF